MVILIPGSELIFFNAGCSEMCESTKKHNFVINIFDGFFFIYRVPRRAFFGLRTNLPSQGGNASSALHLDDQMACHRCRPDPYHDIGIDGEVLAHLTDVSTTPF